MFGVFVTPHAAFRSGRGYSLFSYRCVCEETLQVRVKFELSNLVHWEQQVAGIVKQRPKSKLQVEDNHHLLGASRGKRARQVPAVEVVGTVPEPFIE